MAAAKSAPVDPRLRLIQTLQTARAKDSLVICYVTSTRPGLESQMAMDVIPVLHEHLRAIRKPPNKVIVDLLLHTNGGDGTVPWRLVTLIREFAHELNLLVPYKAF